MIDRYVYTDSCLIRIVSIDHIKSHPVCLDILKSLKQEVNKHKKKPPPRKTNAFLRKSS